ncbi:MAG: NADH-quinone oxidoreductase subunit H [Phycisphaerales bacterium JB060]
MTDLLSFISAQLIVSVTVYAVMVHVLLAGAGYFTYAERKISAYIQDRIGPNRTGFDLGLPFLKFLKGPRLLGLGQPLADGIKFMLKEDYTPGKVDKVLFTLAPGIVVIPALIGFAIIPWGGLWACPSFTIPFLNLHVESGIVQIAALPVNVGVIYMIAIASLGVYGITLGGWASNNKYSFLGGLRATAQMLAYELPLGISLLCVLVMVGSLLPMDIIAYQETNGWLIASQPIAALIFFIAMLAEANRTPFDNAEAESELVGGYHTEYNSMRFALFFLAEYSHVAVSAAFFALLFLGGFTLSPVPGLSDPLTATGATGLLAVLAKLGVYFGKVGALVFLIMLVRWTVPRLRYDQVMSSAWQGMIPLALVVLVLTSVAVFFGIPQGLPHVGVMLGGNLVLGVILWFVVARLPAYNPNRKIQMLGSRFNPLPGERVEHMPSDPMAVEDRPVQGTVQPS